MSYTVHQAKTNLSRLLKEAEAGQEVIITRGKQPVAKLIAIAPETRVPDMFKDQLRTAPEAFDPLTDEELRELGFV
jgi:prevent-host-death family protein